MEIKPIQGQPGLFKQGLDGTRWTSTFAGPMFNAPFGSHRKRSGFGALVLPAEYVSKTRADSVTQSDIGEGQVPGITFTAYIPLKSEAIPQPKLDSIFRSVFAQLGYDVSGSAIDLANLAYQWKFDPDAKVWEALPIAGPAGYLKRAPAATQVTTTPTAKDLESAPKAVETYVLLIRPKDLALSPVRVDATLGAARQAAREAGWSNAFLSAEIKGVQPPPEAPKTIVASIAPWIALIGVGWLATLAARGKVST